MKDTNLSCNILHILYHKKIRVSSVKINKNTTIFLCSNAKEMAVQKFSDRGKWSFPIKEIAHFLSFWK